MIEVNYVASKTLTAFHRDREHFVRAVMGPIGSGKSVGCLVDVLMKCIEQRPNSEGKRKTRWAIIRNTYRELIDTTIRTFFDWFPEQLGHFKKMDLEFVISIPLKDGTTLEAEFLFRALDKPKDVKKLLSLELTGAFMNEAREIPKVILDMICGRVGRYPSMRDGGATWWGVILDTNPPDSDHWWYKLFEENCPDNFKLYKQPSGLAPNAENIHNLPKAYYINMMGGKDAGWINVYVKGEYGFVQDGKPVYPEYHDSIHATNEPIILNKKKRIIVGIDFGLTPAALFVQQSSTGRWLAFDELVTENCGSKTFGRLLNQKINDEYPEYEFEFYGDPAGVQRAQTDEMTPFMMLQSEGINAVPTYTNDYTIRREAVANTLQRLDFAGNIGFVIGPKAPTFRKAMAGGYKYKRVQVTGQDKYQDMPDKNKYSHIAEAGQYALVGGGEGSRVIESKGSSDKLDYSEVDRGVT